MRKSVGPILPQAPSAEPADGSIPRRTFVQLLGASVAAVGSAACRPPPEKILPYVRQPREVTPGVPVHYATSITREGTGIGILVESHQGHPTKVEGNPGHPASLGATSVYEQALPLDLYDSNRASTVREGASPRTWRAFRAALNERLKNAGKGERLRFLVDPEASPFLLELRARIRRRFPAARFVSHSAAMAGPPFEDALIAFGRPLVTRYRLDRADVILALDHDFLEPSAGSWHLRYTREFSRRRDPDGNMNRLYMVEPGLSVTGGMADHRLAVRAGAIGAFLQSVAGRIKTLAPESGLSGALLPGPRSAEGEDFGRWADAVAGDLHRAAGRSLVMVGDRQPAAIRALAHAINGALKNIGSTVHWVDPVLDMELDAGPGALAGLRREIDDGAVDTLLISAWNPAYAAPANVPIGPAIAKVPNSIYLGMFEDETWARARWRIPAAHVLESWGDARAEDGTLSIVQPLIAPLFGGIQEASVLGAFLSGSEASPHVRLRNFWAASRAGADFDSRWKSWLAAGVVPGGELPGQTPEPRWETVGSALRALPVSTGDSGLEVAFALDDKVYDGRFATNAWLQELPHPMNKITWDNAAAMSPATAERLGLSGGEIVILRHRGRTLEAPIWISPGHADDAVTLPLGYGRHGVGVPMSAGFDAYALRRDDSPWFGAGLELARTGRFHAFARTQTHADMEERPIALESTLEAYLANPDMLDSLRGPQPAFYRLPEVTGPQTPPAGIYQWGMGIDLNRCTGCSACVIACQAENNIPVVGKEQVSLGREMHWLRIDRYFTGTPSEPEVITQPMACVHCENAPCEYVCPVNATVHSEEGLNEMVYNRCVGTRYCSNNCPYKVRRFNYLNYTRPRGEPQNMARNPDVTVRSRGVMEKCTYCVQRIERARIDARIEGRTIREAELTTACAQACPAEAIVFGTLTDPDTAVSKWHRNARRYDVLHSLGTRPRTAYLQRIRNRNTVLEE